MRAGTVGSTHNLFTNSLLGSDTIWVPHCQIKGMRSLLLVSALFLCLSARASDRVSPDESTIYDSDPKHLWNRLNETLFLRTAPDGKQYGLNELDVLYWFTTKHLLAEPSHSQAVGLLDEFIQGHGENLVRDPLKRALLQRDLW